MKNSGKMENKKLFQAVAFLHSYRFMCQSNERLSREYIKTIVISCISKRFNFPVFLKMR